MLSLCIDQLFGRTMYDVLWFVSIVVGRCGGVGLWLWLLFLLDSTMLGWLIADWLEGLCSSDGSRDGISNRFCNEVCLTLFSHKNNFY